MAKDGFDWCLSEINEADMPHLKVKGTFQTVGASFEARGSFF